MTEKMYHVVARRDPEDRRFWLADVSGLDGAHTYARNLSALNRFVREVIVLAEDLPDGTEESLSLEWEYHTGDQALDDLAGDLRRRREQVEAEARRLTDQTNELTRKLVTEQGYSVRDAATLLAVSPSRIGQLSARRKPVDSGRPAA